jgi:hypothetical protein
MTPIILMFHHTQFLSRIFLPLILSCRHPRKQQTVQGTSIVNSNLAVTTSCRGKQTILCVCVKEEREEHLQ